MSDGRDDADDAGRDVNAAFSEEDYLPDPEEDERLLADYPGDPPTPCEPYPRKEKRKRPGRRTGSELELESRIDFVLLMLCQDWPTSEIKKKVVGSYGVSVRMAEIYIARARETRKRWAAYTKSDAFEESVSFYKGILMDPRKTTAEKFRARERLDVLHELESDRRTPVPGRDSSSPAGGVQTIEVREVVVTTRVEARAILYGQPPQDESPDAQPVLVLPGGGEAIDEGG